MARLGIFAIPLALFAQQDQDRQLKEAGVCARCHVISVVEWGMSRHWKAGTSCVSCHGASQGHVIDERNNVKPERVPHAAAIAPLCAGCHGAACPKTKHASGCETCHHVHALVNPSAAVKPVEVPPVISAPQARRAYSLPPGFEIVSEQRDSVTGLPRAVRVAGLQIPMALVPGGEIDIGSEAVANARPVHTVHVEPFYLGQKEITRAEWVAVMGPDSAAAQPANPPATNISWHDAQAFLGKLNAAVPGGVFRLPTEAEWEFAARAAGLIDVSGAVWDWCSSLLMPYPYLATDGRESPGASGLRILRGGANAGNPGWVTVASRHGERPNRRFPYNGLRIARSIGTPHLEP